MRTNRFNNAIFNERKFHALSARAMCVNQKRQIKYVQCVFFFVAICTFWCANGKTFIMANDKWGEDRYRNKRISLILFWCMCVSVCESIRLNLPCQLKYCRTLKSTTWMKLECFVICIISKRAMMAHYH